MTITEIYKELKETRDCIKIDIDYCSTQLENVTLTQLERFSIEKRQAFELGEYNAYTSILFMIEMSGLLEKEESNNEKDK